MTNFYKKKNQIHFSFYKYTLEGGGGININKYHEKKVGLNL